MWLLYKKEKEIVKKAKKIISNFNYSKREEKKKLFELFHLLVFLEITDVIYDSILPHDPGDFILKKGNSNTMIEITTVFGNKNNNIAMTNILSNLFKIPTKNTTNNNLIFETNFMKNPFLTQLKEKQNKNYNLKLPINKRILLIVTGEYDNCAITGSWLFKLIEKNEIFIKDNFEQIWILNYFASGKDNGPIIIEDFFKEFTYYKNFYE